MRLRVSNNSPLERFGQADPFKAGKEKMTGALLVPSLKPLACLVSFGRAPHSCNEGVQSSSPE